MPLCANGRDTSPTVASLRLASGTLRTALARLGQEPALIDREQLVTEARAHLGAALHLVDGVGRALKEELGLNTRREQAALREGRGALAAARGEGQR